MSTGPSADGSHAISASREPYTVGRQPSAVRIRRLDIPPRRPIIPEWTSGVNS